MKTVNPIEPGQEWTVELFSPEDAPGVTSLFREVYGEEYPVKTYLDPDLLIKENAAGRVISSVAKTSRGDIVGHNALFNSAPCKAIFETGAGLVHRDYRGGHGIFTQMVAHGLIVGKESYHVELAYGEPVCNHPFSQRLTRGMEFVTRAVEINLMPAAAYAREKSAPGRVTTLLEFRTLKSKPCTVYVPGAYEHLFPVFYAEMDDARTFVLSDKTLPAVPTRLTTQEFAFANVARVAVMELGADIVSVMGAEESRLFNQGIRVIQVWVPTGSPWVGQAVDGLRGMGYFFGGVLPRWLDTDAVLMEKVLDIPDWEGMVLHFDRARELVAHVRHDWERTIGEGSWAGPGPAGEKERP